MKLNEGEIHTFQVIKQVQIPDEGEFYMLRHQSGRRLLLPCETYKNFNIQAGQSIDCRIDKVSCSGKVYLEPLHPIYKEGEGYNFEILCIEQQADNKYIINVKDCFGNSISIQTFNNYIFTAGEKSIYLKVLRLKKGVPILSLPVDTDISTEDSSHIGEKLLFHVKEMSKNSDNEEVYILSSPEGLTAELKYKHFKSYGFLPGEKIICEVYGFTHQGLLKIEPENPYYKIGESYSFKVVNLNEEDYFDRGDDAIIMVRDEFGNKCGVSIKPELYQEYNKKTQLECRVKGFRKGRPRLELA